MSLGLCCIALLGVWNFRGTNGHGGKVALPDWESIALNGRQVYIAFDSDVMTKPEVHAALVRLREFLGGRHAHVSLIYLPPGEGGTKMGLDDYLAAGHSVAALLQLASNDVRGTPRDEGDGPPYQMSPEGIVWLKSTRDGTLRTPLTNFPARIIGDVIQDDGAGVAQRAFDIEAELNGHYFRFRILASQYGGMGWTVEHLGAGAIVHPGFGLKDHARAAIQQLSGHVPERCVFTSTPRMRSSPWTTSRPLGA